MFKNDDDVVDYVNDDNDDDDDDNNASFFLFFIPIFYSFCLTISLNFLLFKYSIHIHIVISCYISYMFKVRRQFLFVHPLSRQPSGGCSASYYKEFENEFKTVTVV